MWGDRVRHAFRDALLGCFLWGTGLERHSGLCWRFGQEPTDSIAFVG